MEGILATMQREHKNKVTELHATVERLLQVGFPHNMHLLCSSMATRLYQEGLNFSYIMEREREKKTTEKAPAYKTLALFLE